MDGERTHNTFAAAAFFNLTKMTKKLHSEINQFIESSEGLKQDISALETSAHVKKEQILHLRTEIDHLKQRVIEKKTYRAQIEDELTKLLKALDYKASSRILSISKTT